MIGFPKTHPHFHATGHEGHIVNVHLTPFQVRRGGGIGNTMAALSTTEDTHSAEAASIKKAIDPQQPTVIVGDFNSLSTFNAPKSLVEMGFVDAYASVHEGADSHPTRHWPTRPLPLALRIDFIFHMRHFATTKAQVIRRKGSDHSLVVAELERHESSHPQERSAGPERDALPSPSDK